MVWLISFLYKFISYITETPVFTVAPNPASSYVHIIPGSGIDAANATIVITDFAGHTLVMQKMTSAGGQRINLSSFAKGMYSISIITPQSTQTQKLVVR